MSHTVAATTHNSRPHRSAAEIRKTAQGPRPLPALGIQRAAAADLPNVDTVLANGLRVIAVRMPAVPVVQLRLAVPFADPAESLVGSTHAAQAELLAATILAGTSKRTRARIDTELALAGGGLNATVDSEELSITGNALASHSDVLLDVLADVLTDATYPVDEVGRERDRLVEQVALARSQPKTIAQEALLTHLFGTHPYAKHLPEVAEVTSTSREDVAALHTRAVSPRQSVLVIVGDIDPDATVRDIDNALAGWRSSNDAVKLRQLPDVKGGDLVLVDRAGAVQSQIRLAARSIPRTDPRYPAWQLANLALGGYFSSRLIENLREDKGYTYSIRSTPEFTAVGSYMIVSTDTASEVSAAAIMEIQYELAKLALVPPTASEVDSARQYAIGSILIGTASQSGLASFLAMIALLGHDLEWIRAHSQRLANVTVDQVTEAALEFFAPANFTGVVVGDASVLTPRLRALGGIVLP